MFDTKDSVIIFGLNIEGGVMKSTLKAGIVLGVAVEIWVYLMGFMGWYKDPAMLNLFWLVILIQIGVLVWGLRLTAKEGKTYGQQVGAGVLMSLVGGAIIFGGSLLFTTLVFPHYFEEVRKAGEEMMRQQGISDADITTQLDAMAPMQTSFMQALQGLLGTVITGAVVSLIVALFFRKKPEGQPAA